MKKKLNPRIKSVNLTTALILIFAVLFIVFTVVTQKQSLIRLKASQVMPFSQDAAMHIFKSTADGGIQQIVIRRSQNSNQIKMIRQHLQMEAMKFSKGDFSDPAAIHGENMPGLSELEKSASKIRIQYSDLTNGAQIQYRTSDSGLIEAIHIWFQAQLSDHGSDAMEM